MDDIVVMWGASSVCTLILLGLIFPSEGCGYPYAVTGEVVHEPTTRYVRHAERGYEKVAITLRPQGDVSRELNVSFNGEEIMIECMSTRCTQVHVGEVHSFRCGVSHRWFEPDVVVCKHDKKMLQ